MRTPTNPLWGFAIFAILATELGFAVAKGDTTGAEIVGVFLIPVVAWMVAWCYGFYKRRP